MRVENKDILSLFSSADWGVSQVSRPIKVEHIFGYTIDIELSGNLVGVAKVQFSNDTSQTYDLVNLSSFRDILYASTTKDVADNTIIFSAINSMHKWIRFSWVPSSGTGTLLSARYMEKGT